MAPPHAVFVLDTAGRLDRELAAVAGYLDDPSGLFRRDARTAFLRRALETVAVTARLLHAYALDAMAPIAEAAIDDHERAVRGRAHIVMRALHVLAGRTHEVPAAALSGRFSSAGDVSAFLVDEVSHIYARWKEQRDAARLADGALQRALRDSAIDDAEVAFERLGRDRDFATFVRVGSTAESEPVRIACRELAAVMGVSPSAGERYTLARGRECAS